MELVVVLWALVGAANHADWCHRAKTWCGIPVWRVPLTYVMFFPAMILGPLMLLMPKFLR